MELFNIAFTGPREVDLEDVPGIAQGFRKLILRANTNEWETAFHSGGAAGFDSMVFEYLGDLSVHARHTLHIPFEYQWRALQEYIGLPGFMLLEYTKMCSQCGPKEDYVRPTDNWLYQKRNEHMVDSAQLLVYYNPWKKGGTQNCIDYAKTTGIEMVSIFDL